MKNLTKTLIAAAALSAVASSAMAQASATDDASVGITIIRPVTIASTGAGLQFGTVVKGDGSVAVSAAGVRSVGGDVVALGSTTASAAKFNVTAEPGQALEWTIPPSITLSGPESLTVDILGGDAAPASLATGTYQLTLGGEIALAETTQSGLYTGTLEVTVEYQ